MAYMSICSIPKCANKTCARLNNVENTKRRDMCYEHILIAMKIWKGEVEITETWNGITKENIQDDLKEWEKMYE